MQPSKSPPGDTLRRGYTAAYSESKPRDADGSHTETHIHTDS